MLGLFYNSCDFSIWFNLCCSGRVVLLQTDVGNLFSSLIKGNINVVEQFAVLVSLCPLQWQGALALNFALSGNVGVAAKSYVDVFVKVLCKALGIFVHKRNNNIGLTRFFQTSSFLIGSLGWISKSDPWDLGSRHLILGIFRYRANIADFYAINFFDVGSLQKRLPILEHVGTQDWVIRAISDTPCKVFGTLIKLMVTYSSHLHTHLVEGFKGVLVIRNCRDKGRAAHVIARGGQVEFLSFIYLLDKGLQASHADFIAGLCWVTNFVLQVTVNIGDIGDRDGGLVFLCHRLRAGESNSGNGSGGHKLADATELH